MNPALVTHVIDMGDKTYIAFDFQDHDAVNEVIPKGVETPHGVEEVIRPLNRAYWIDLALRFGGALAAVVGGAAGALYYFGPM